MDAGNPQTQFMKGKLTDQPLAELIREIADKEMSGSVRLEHEQAQTVIYFEHGQIVYAAANLRTLRLREYLVKRAAITETERARFNANLSDLDLAEALASSRTMRRNDIDALLTILVSDVLRVALLWTEGTWELDERARLAKSVQLSFDIPTLLREAARRMPYAFVSQRFRNASEMISRASEISPTSNLQASESFILSRLDDDLKLGELIMLSGQPEIDALHVIYGLTLSGLLRREFWRNAFRTDPSKLVKDTATASSASSPSVTQTEQSDNWVSATLENEELEKFLTRLRNATNYYEVLELPRSAQANEIKESYYAMARRYHPDRFHLKSGTRLHAEISSAFARVTQSYETLTDSNARLTYDHTLQRSDDLARTQKANDPVAKENDADDFDSDTDAPNSDLGRADYHFREGFGALQQGRISAAIKHLSNAARLQPEDAKFRAHYGRALAADDNTRRLAENELQTAVKLEPENVTFRTMLAELYFQLNFHRRARTELDRALALDPRNAAAHSLLRKLEKSRKVG
jgi:tetratricopeptide (TPR) repeat protein